MSEFGQINETTIRYQILSKTIKKYKPKTIVEIGTWKGLGSTLCILESMEQDSDFTTLESNKTFYDIAVSNLKTHEGKLKMIYGSSVSYDEVNTFASNYTLENFKKEWLKDDLNNINLCPDVINEIPNKIDFLLLDGGEFSTYSEWQILKSRTKIVALDDIRELKTKQIYEELINDDNYELVIETPDGNGFCVFIKK